MKNNYQELKMKILFRMFVNLGIAAILGFIILKVFIDGILQDPFARFVIRTCEILGFSNADAYNIYRQVFRNNKKTLLTVGFIMLIIIFFYYTLSKVTRYLNQIADAVDRIIDEDESIILLPNELKPMEDKLNQIKLTLKQREAEAKEAEQRKNDLVVYLAHDLKTPLTSVIGYLNLLHDEKQISEELRMKYLSIALEKADRLEDLINEFFEITRFNMQNIILEKTNVNLARMMEQLVDEMYPLMSEKELHVKLNLIDNISIVGDSDKLARVFDNLLKNAISYSFISSEIKIIVEEIIEGVNIKIKNNGKPIPSHKLDGIFEKFYRLDTARTSRTGGAGLGLAIAKEIVELHGGQIKVESCEEYTEFTVFLPIENKVKYEM
ncbi:vancomycin resistance histidine kinase VanS [Tissierella sp. P1]|uniref:sensor histidine kinase n=1 Tax=unclassified Tissierella TaxID=2638726 RepID=UPI000BA03697|nr:HAMP domain-containing sensor histidine kinase [Tissierella sp. P1]OZV11887.1 vancomycin resistance histidine kinase VanS [Tissierella sp. P1]